MTAPWPRERMELHVKQRIRERVDIAIRAFIIDEELDFMLREGGEDSVWAVIQQALSEAGWVIEPLDGAA